MGRQNREENCKNFKTKINKIKNMKNRKKIVITGGAGFIGSQLGYRLDKKGHKVLLLDNMSFGYEDNLTINGESFGELVIADIRSKNLEKYFHDTDYIFHFAAISALPVCQNDPALAMSVNVAGTANVLEAARRANVKRVIFASTSAIYENNTNFPCKENDNVHPTLMYPISKFNSEQLCRIYRETYGMKIVVLRYYNVYGPSQDSRRKSPPLISYVIRELLNNKAPVLHSNGKQKRDYVYIDDVNKINMLSMNHPEAPGKTFNVASGQVYSVNEIYEIIANILKSPLKPVFTESTKFWDKYPELFKGEYRFKENVLEHEVNKFTLGSTEKTMQLLDWKTTVPIKEGLKRTIEYTIKNRGSAMEK